MESRYTVNGVQIKRPSSFKIERYNLTTLTRIANGDMHGDRVARKRKFYFDYDAISSDELNKILDAIWECGELFFKLTYVENNVVKEADVYAGSIPTQLHHTGSLWVWQNVSFSLIER